MPKNKREIAQTSNKNHFFRLRRQGTKKHAKKSNDKRILRAKFAAVRRRKFSGDLFALKISRNAARRAAKIFGRPNRGFWASCRRKATEACSEKKTIVGRLLRRWSRRRNSLALSTVTFVEPRRCSVTPFPSSWRLCGSGSHSRREWSETTAFLGASSARKRRSRSSRQEEAGASPPRWTSFLPFSPFLSKSVV